MLPCGKFQGAKAPILRALERQFQVSGFRFQCAKALVSSFRFQEIKRSIKEEMERVRRFEDLAIYQSARQLCKEIYTITQEGEFQKDIRFVQQIHAAAGSIMDNIAEGYERDGNKEFINFLYIAKGSCGEVRSQIIRASDVCFIDPEKAKKLYNDCISLSRVISAFIKSLKQSNLPGTKYLKPET